MATKRGMLNKEGTGMLGKNFKKRYFELRGDQLVYFYAEGGEEVGKILLAGTTIREDPSKKGQFSIAGTHLRREYVLQAESDADRADWVAAMRDAIKPKAAPAAARAPGVPPAAGAPRESQTEDGEVDAAEQTFERSVAAGGVRGAATGRKITLEDFELVTTIGRGSFGKVFKVRLKGDPRRTPLAMKVMRKDVIVQEDLPANIKREKSILQQISHPFIVRLHYAFQTKERLYLILDLLPGGELFFHLKTSSRFSLPRARMYAAEIVSALTHLHEHDIVYRDLKPENVVLDKDGRACLTDFGLAKTEMAKELTYTFCGTPEYLAPEILKGKGHGKGVDWWALGCMLYEMLTSLPPFYSVHISEMYDHIINKPLTFPPEVPDDARDLITRLLERDVSRRLIDGRAVMAHPFFASAIDFDRLVARGYTPEFVPDTRDDDTKYVDDEFKLEGAVMSVVQAVKLGQVADTTFAGFTFDERSMARG